MSNVFCAIFRDGLPELLCICLLQLGYDVSVCLLMEIATHGLRAYGDRAIADRGRVHVRGA